MTTQKNNPQITTGSNLFSIAQDEDNSSLSMCDRAPVFLSTLTLRDGILHKFAIFRQPFSQT